MGDYTLTHLSDRDLAIRLATAVRYEATATALVLAHIAEFDARKLHVPAGYPSMHAYCVRELGFSEDAAFKRIQIARTARQIPAVFELLAEGRLHLTGAGILTPHLTRLNAPELLNAAADKTKAEIEELVARRFPRTEFIPLVMAAQPPVGRPVAATLERRGSPVAPSTTDVPRSPAHQSVQAKSCILAPAQVAPATIPSRVAPVAQDRFVLQVSIGRSLREKLQYAQDLASHTIQPGDLAALLERMADAYIAGLEKRKFAATDKPRPLPRGANDVKG